MQTTVFTFIYIASAPFFLLPSILAFFTKPRGKLVILGVNLVVWIGVYLVLRQIVVRDASDILALPISVAVVVWLVLLRFALRGERSQ